MSKITNNVSGHNSDNINAEASVDSLLLQLECTGEEIPSQYKKSFDKIHRALEARAKYLTKRKRSHKHNHLSFRQAGKDAKLHPQGLRDFYHSCINLPSILSRFLSESTLAAHNLNEVATSSQESIKTLHSTLTSHRFKATTITAASLTALRWILQKPTFATFLIDIIQFILTSMSSFVTISAESIIRTAQEIVQAAEPVIPAQPSQGIHMVPQGGSSLDIHSYIPMVSGVVSLLGTALLGTQVIATPSLLKSLKSFGEIGRATQGLKQLAENSMSFVSWILESVEALIFDYRGKSMVDSDPVCKSCDITNTFMAEVDDLLDPVKFDEYMMSKNFKQRLSDARYRLLQFTGIKGRKSDPALRTHIISRITALTKLLTENMQKFVGLGGAIRKVPFCIQLTGEPGCGKSSIMSALSSFLLSEEGCGRVLENEHVSTMTGVNKYWDGFRGESGLAIDDAFMTRGSTPGESEYTRFISLISCVSMIVPKADLNSKGMTADSIRLVVLSSNCEKPKATEINNSDALLRRRHLVLWVVRKPSTDLRIDPHNDYSRYVRKNPITGELMGEAMTFTEMVKLASQQFKAHLSEQEALTEKTMIPKDILSDNPKGIVATPFEGDFEVSDGYDEVDSSQEFKAEQARILSESMAATKVWLEQKHNAKLFDEAHREQERIPTLDWSARDAFNYNDRPNDRPRQWNRLKPQALTYREPRGKIQTVYDHCDYDGIISDAQTDTKYVLLYDIKPQYDQEALSYFYNSEAVCCSSVCMNLPVNLYDGETFKYCNATRDFKDDGLYLGYADFSYDNLTPEHRRIFNITLDSGLNVPPYHYCTQFDDPDKRYYANMWEAIRVQERAFRNYNFNQNNICITDLYENACAIGPPVDHHQRRTAHNSRHYQRANEFADKYYRMQPQGILNWFYKDNVQERAKLIIKALGVVASLFAAVKLFSALKKLIKGSDILIPNLDYGAQDLENFLQSAPEAYRGQLTDAISGVAIQIQKEQTMAAQAMMYDGTARINKSIKISPQGIVYDGSAKTAKRMALKVQAIFAQNNIQTRSSIDMVNAMHPQGVDENFSQKRLAIMRNMVTFHTPVHGDKPVMRGIGVSDTHVLVPYHLIRTFPVGTEMRIKHGHVDYNVRMEKGMLKLGGNHQDNDWAILTLPQTVNSFKNILHTFIRESHIQLLSKCAPITLQRGFQGDTGHASLDLSQEEIIDDVIDGETVERTIARGLIYYMMTADGDCGSAILLNSNSVDGILTGIHVAGDNNKGMSQLVTREMLENTIPTGKHFKKESLEHMRPFILTEQIDEVEANKKIQNAPQLPAWGLVPNAFASVPAGKSSIKKSRITLEMDRSGQEFFQTKRATPTFSLNDHRVDEDIREAGIKPMSLALNKYAEAPHTFPSRALNLAYLTICTVLSTIIPKGVEKRLLTFDETLNGIKGFMIGIDVRTSMGFPYTKLSRGTKGKSALLLDENDGYKTGKEAHYVLNEKEDGPRFQGRLLSHYFKDRYNEVERQITQGIVPTYFAYENMKDELVSAKKIKNAKVRTFECLPLEISLLTRKYFGVFMGTMQQVCVQEPISVGINPTSLDWTLLYKRLTRFGKDAIIAGDYSNWDGKLMADVILKAIQAINVWYGDSQENQDARIALALSFIHTDIIVLNTLVRKRSGMPSGVPVTAPLNSLCNWFYILAAVVDMLEQQEFEKNADETLTPEFLISNMELAVYGDDHAIALSVLLRKYLNFQKFAQYFANIGINYTDSQKRENVDFLFENIHQITYLKRRFLPDKEYPALIRAPLDINSITDMIYWTKTSPTTPEHDVYASRVKDFEDSLAQHEQETYDRHIEIYNRAISVIQERQPDLIKNFPKIMTPYETHTQTFLSERGQ